MNGSIPQISADKVGEVLTPQLAIESQRAAFQALGRDEVDLPHKIMHPSRFGDGVAFAYLSRMSAGTGAVAKIGSVHPGNAELGLPSISATVLAMHPVTGRPFALLDGTVISTVRTAAASAVAADELAVPGPARLGLLGSGVQARAHAMMLAEVRPLTEILVWSPREVSRTATADELTRELGIPARAVATPREAVTDAGLVVTCTLSKQPVLEAGWLADGATVLCIGSFEPDRHEVGTDVLRRAGLVAVDDVHTAVGHTGPVMAALADGTLAEADLAGLGALLNGERPGRSGPKDVVFYASVGLGVQDAAAAWAVLDALGMTPEG
ncbi:ornithine cyclodeaminase family protein [Pseudonocardiaceae bacterium YIM PH 21723]|nr:ornithine cyclodeaminase family protein [Pseudonocardiaceae bacterium YIM PH 21723]